MVSSPNRELKIEPEFLGPLADRPLDAAARSADQHELFPGASVFLAGRHQRRRAAQWTAIRPRVERMLRPEEHILYVAHGMQVPPALHFLALGAMALPYHQVMLIVTDMRLIEVLLGVRGKTVETRVRSFPWSSVRAVKTSLGKLTLAAQRGKKHAWRIPLRGDLKLLKLLVGRLTPRLMQEGEGMAQAIPLWHCPNCAAQIPANPRACDSCHTSFRSPRLAALLSMAFPGAGLFYAGHPFLAAADFFGELVFYLLFLLLMIEAEPGGVVLAVGVGALLFVLTKLESIHLSQILVARSKPETEPRRSGYRRFALVSGLASLILIGGAFPLAGAARVAVDRDLDVARETSAWHVSRVAAEWRGFGDDPSARSQWSLPSDERVTLFAYPQHMLDSVTEFRDELRSSLREQGMTILTDDEDVPAPYRGFRFITLSQTSEGEPVATVQYFVVDEQNRDIHQAVAGVIGEDPAGADDLVRDLLSQARWIEANPPRRAEGS